MLDFVAAKLSRSRFEHSLRVEDLAKKLAKIWQVDETKTSHAAILHDIGRSKSLAESVQMLVDFGTPPDEIMQAQPVLLHAFSGSLIAKKELGIEDEEILEAIAYHTIAKAGMSLLAEIIFLADMTESGRSWCGVDTLRELQKEDIKKAMFFALEETIKWLKEQGKMVHPSAIEAYNYYTELMNIKS